MKFLIQIFSLGATFVGGIPVVAGSDPPVGIPQFLENHCFECHDEDVSKGDLDLASLDFDPTDPENFSRWERVFDRVSKGEMPPEKKERPEADAIAGFLGGLEQPLAEADLADIRANGRVRTRRLTRNEYEHTIHDLLGIDVPLKGELPEDPVTYGFETVASGQQLSQHHLARYLDVADLALEAAFARALGTDSTFEEFHTPEALAKKGGGNYRGPDLRNGLSIAWPMRLQFAGRMPVTRVKESGWYRITLKGVHGVNPGKDGAVWGSLNSGECASNAPILFMVGAVEATAEKRDLVYEAYVQGGHMLRLIADDGELKNPPSGASGGNISYKGRDLAQQGFSGIAHSGIKVERIYPNAEKWEVKKRLFGKFGADLGASNPEEAADQLIGEFARRAFRRPVNERQLADYRKLAREALSDGKSLAEALRIAYRALLCSPRFLTFVEAPGELDDHAMASRLSYMFWLSMPDDDLTKLAEAGKLGDPAVLKAQVDRMLDDPKAERFIASFTDQWLNLKEIDFTAPDPRQFGKFDQVVQTSMVAETREYVADMIRNDLGVANLVDSEYAFLNGRLARHYQLQLDDLDLKAGEGMQKVSLSNGEKKHVRGGLLTQGAVLKVTADGTTTSPVVRGVFVNERILGEHIPPPPPNIPAIEPDIRGATSIKDQLDKHRSSTSCYACHNVIDPPGFALENFDPVGGWRTKYGIKANGKPVDPTGVTPDGVEFANLVEWKRIYRGRPERLARGFAEQFLTYASGAPIRFSDRIAVAKVIEGAKGGGYGVRSIIRHAVASRIMRNK